MSHLDLADGLRRLEAAKSGDQFGHAEHLQFAWSVLDEAKDLDEAIRIVSMTIEHVSALAGNPDKFHRTMTVFWVRVLEMVRRQHPQVQNLEQALHVFPDLTDPDLPRTHWSDFDRDELRKQWIEPDLKPIP